MSASTSDKFTDTRNAARPNSARVTSPRNAGGTSLVTDDLSGWPTASKVHFVTYRLDSSSNIVAGSQLDCTGIVSGNTINSLTVVDGTDNGSSVNDVVEMLPTAAWGQDLADALTVSHERTGVLKDDIVTTAKIASSAVTADEIASNAVTTAKILDSNITTAKIAAGAITSAKLSPTKVTHYYGIAVTDGSWNDISDLSKTITVPSDGTHALLIYNAAVKISSPPAISTNVRLYDTTTSTFLAATRSDVWNSNGVGHHGFIGTATLSAGDHTIKLQQRVSTGSGEVMYANFMVILLNS